ncbi:MAG: SusD/RagB family nutrient-binding outer membrane lipoprotein, partial [Bacteroidota bacterium]|nr:SusD/RagB family nutrient-binding outer membrane lipoprotein [Bacteroidota bacterium]
MKLNNIFITISFSALLFTACKKESFVNANIDPNVLYSVDPADQFLAAASSTQNSFEYYYDVYRNINEWMQYTTSAQGNGYNFTGVGADHFNARYGTFYSQVGLYLSDIPALVAKMNANAQAARVYQVNIAAIFKAYYAFYVSDINGSIPYSQAFQARYGGTQTPVYDPQPALFDTLDRQIKAAVATLETTQS